MTDTTDPQTDRTRALHLLEAADFLRDAHFRDGLTVQEAITGLRHMADEADPMVGSLARDGFGLDEIAAMPAVPPASADRAAIVAAIKASPFQELRSVDHAANGPLQITVKVDDLADVLLRRLSAAAPAAEPESGCAHRGGPHAWDDCEAYTALVADEEQQAETPCGAWGGCPLPSGHNRGRADIPENHQPPAVVAEPGKENGS